MYLRRTVSSICIWLIALLAGCSSAASISEKELEVLNEIIADHVGAHQIFGLSLNQEAAEKFPSVKKMLRVQGSQGSFYAVLVSPQGYRAPIDLMVVINAEKNEVTGIKIIQQDETPGYGEWLAEKWFTDRFRQKTVEKYLERTVLEAKKPNEIIQITSATITTQAVLNGVNSAMGVYRETVLGEKADPVPLKVEGFILEE